jgi:hypothetical protein
MKCQAQAVTLPIKNLHVESLGKICYPQSGPFRLGEDWLYQADWVLCDIVVGFQDSARDSEHI